MVVAILLAAGAGSRFAGDTHKLLAPLRGRPVLAHALDAVRASGLDVIVVTGAVDVSALLDPGPDDPRVSDSGPADPGPANPGRAHPGLTVVHNPDWAAGQATSVQLGIEVAAAAGHDAVVVGLGDQPFLTADAWRAVAAVDEPVVVATYGGRRGHPVRLGREVWPLLPERGDRVGRAVFESRPDLIREIRCDGEPIDIDTLEDLHRWS